MPYVREYERALDNESNSDVQLESHKIISVEIVDGSELSSKWKSPMQVVITDMGKFIDNMPGKLFGFMALANPSFDWKAKIGHTVDGIKIFKHAGYNWLNKQ